MKPLLDPLFLPLTPPMDLNASTRGGEPISAMPLQLRCDRSIGLFGARRDDGGTGLIRFHQGIDLLARQGEKIFASASGKVVLVNSITGGVIIAIHHYPLELGYITRYVHLQNPLVNVGDEVDSGQQIGEVGPPAPVTHLHFEVRQLFHLPTRGIGDASSSLPLDPTQVMANWEQKMFKNDTATRAGHILDNVEISSIDDVWRDRMIRLFKVNLDGSNQDLYLPLYQPSEADLQLIDTIKKAFFQKLKVRVVWRDSLFWSQIQSDSTANIIAEVKVYS